MHDGGTKSSLVRKLGFNAARRRALLKLIGLTATDHAHAAYLQRRVIVPDIDVVVDAFYKTLGANPDVRRILATGFALAHLRETQRQYLLTLGVGFDTASYFETRLRIGATHARVAVPPSLYQAAYALLQRLILKRVRLRAAPRRQAALTEFLIKIAALDMALAIQTYHDARVGDLRSSIKALRGRTAVLHRRAEIDAFTGVAHHARILDVLKQDIASRGERPLTVVIADLDRFKSVNDTCGHPAGDKVLQAISARIRSIARRDDVVGRYGGDEFMVVLKGTPLAVARRIAERMRAGVAREVVEVDGGRLRVTLSAGVAAAQPGDDLDALVARADAALYRAKRTGRNRVVTADRRDSARNATRRRA